jgi:DNA repair protein RecO (recombination protein O)
MPLVRTDAAVLHAFDYLESSRIVRLVTRDAGVQSALARGARRSRTRYGSALDLFASGTAELIVRPGRELHTLTSFEVLRGRSALAADLARFTGASAVAELVLRLTGEEANPALFDLVLAAFDTLADPSTDAAIEVTLAFAWRVVAELGFAPALDACARCDAAIDDAEAAAFGHRAGGVLCPRCARSESGIRTLPADARRALSGWLGGETARSDPVPLAAAARSVTTRRLGDSEQRAHQRLLREFLHEHVADGRPLRAFDVWARDRWDAAVGAPA